MNANGEDHVTCILLCVVWGKKNSVVLDKNHILTLQLNTVYNTRLTANQR